MRSLLLAAFAAAMVLAPLAGPASAAALDPNIRMLTLTTPHFRVNYPAGYQDVAQRAARYAERAHDQLTEYFGTTTSERTELTLFDHTDEVNGLALPYVSKAIYINLTTPDSDFMWGRYDDWLNLVITHEYAHVLHFETVEGLPRHLNNVFGRLLFPNLFQPVFLIEGLAVIAESRFAAGEKGGRGHDGYFDMYLRADVLDNRQLSIDQASGYYLTEFPGGDAPYVYGTYFYKYVIERYGADKPPSIARHYSAAPWLGISAAIAKAIPGRDAQQIWDELRHWLRRRAERQLAAIRKHPVSATTPVTTTRQNHRHPDYLPNGNLIFIEGLRHDFTGLRELVGRESGKPVLRKLLQKPHYGDYDVSPDGKSIYFHKANSASNYYGWDDIFRYDLESGQSTPLTASQLATMHSAGSAAGAAVRISNPGVSPDGESLIAVANHKGSNNLVLLDKAGKLLRRLTALDDATQFTAPRWSPDGKRVVMSAWHKGSRDLFMLDTTTWRTVPLWKDDAVDVGPVWTPDGKHVLFSSDRELGVFNVFAYDWANGTLHQVTNVLTGAIEPAVSPDGRELAMALAVGGGFDIHTLPLDPATWRRVESPAFAGSPAPAAPPPQAPYPASPYSALPSLAPKFWSPLYLSSPATAGLFTLGYDVLLTNTIFGVAGYSLDFPAALPKETSFSPLAQTMHLMLYQNSQFDTNMNLFTIGFPARFPLTMADGSQLDLMQRYDTLTLSLGWNNLPSPLTNASYQTGDVLTVGYNVRNVAHLTPAELNDEAVGLRLLPAAGRSHSLSANYKFNDNWRFGYSNAPEGGRLTTLGAEAAHPALGSQFEFYRFFADWRAFHALPWNHHTLATRAMSGLNFGKPQGDFAIGGARSLGLGGTTDIRSASEPDDDVTVALRGYPSASGFGNTVGLLSGEYRFPIAELQHGPGTLPLFAERLAGAVFAETGTAFTNNWLGGAEGAALPRLADWRASLGAEVRLHFRIGNNPLNTAPLSTVFRLAAPQLDAFNDSSGTLRLGIAQPLLPVTGTNGKPIFFGPAIYTEFGTFF